MVKKTAILGFGNPVREDDGVGMDTAKAKSGIGMKNIKSRVAQIAGSYKIISKMNLGTQIQISFN